LNNLNKNRGGARPNSGPKKGAKYAKTVAKEQAREIARQIITEKLEPLIDAQIANALGIRHLIMRDPATSKLVATDTDDPRVAEAQIDAAMKSGNAVWIYTKDPNVRAITELLDRAIDKPAQQTRLTGMDDGPVLIKWQDEIDKRIAEGRQRAARRNRESTFDEISSSKADGTAQH